MLKTLDIKRPTLNLKRYLLNDTFGDALAAGAVNGTRPLIGDGSRTVVDTESKLSIANGVATFAGEKATPAFGDPALIYQQYTRVAGLTLMASANFSVATEVRIGWEPFARKLYIQEGIRFLNGNVLHVLQGDTGIAVGTFSLNTTYKIVSILRSSGSFLFIKGGSFAKWTMLFLGVVSSNNLAPEIVNNNGVGVVDDFRIPSRLFIPAPLASDGFTLANTTDGLGHAEANGGAGLTWTDPGATWTVAGGVVSNTPSVGAEKLTNGNMETGNPPSNWIATISLLTGVADERTGGSGAQALDVANTSSGAGIAFQNLSGTSVGQWYIMTGWMKIVRAFSAFFDNGAYDGIATSGGSSWASFVKVHRIIAANPVIRLLVNTATILDNARFDDITVKLLTTATLFRTLPFSTPDVYHRAKVVALTAGTQAGIVIRLDSAATPTAGIIVYFDGAGNIKCEEFTGTTTYTAIFTAVVKAFTASDSLVIDVNGTAVRVYHETSAGVQTLIGTGTTSVVAGNLHGLFSTYVGNTITDMNTYPIGTNGEWELLNSL